MAQHGLIRRRASSLAATVLFAAGALLVSLAPGAASAGTQLTASGGTVSVGGNGTTSVSVQLAAVDELNGFDVTLSFNSAVINPTAVSLNGAWNIPLDPGTIGTGTVHVAASRIGYCTGSCPLFTVSWAAVAGGSTSLQPTLYVLPGKQSGVPGNLAQLSASAATIVVTGGTTATSTSTSVPPTNTPSPATNTPVPATNTPAAPTNTPVPATSIPATATPVSTTAPSSNSPVTSPTSVPAATATPTSALVPSTAVAALPAVVDPSPSPASGGEPLPVTSAPPPNPTNNTYTGLLPSISDASGNVPSGANIPLPPRTGSGTFSEAGQPLPLEKAGYGMIAVAIAICTAELIRTRRKKDETQGFQVALENFLEGQEQRGKR